jgi:chromosome segregation ATPase
MEQLEHLAKQIASEEQEKARLQRELLETRQSLISELQSANQTIAALRTELQAARSAESQSKSRMQEFAGMVAELARAVDAQIPFSTLSSSSQHHFAVPNDVSRDLESGDHLARFRTSPASNASFSIDDDDDDDDDDEHGI